MPERESTREMMARIASMTPEERKRLAQDGWEKLEWVRDLNLPELTEEEWDEVDARYNARFTSAAANRP